MDIHSISKRPVVYVSGPLSAQGRWLTNIHKAAKLNAILQQIGFAPICPHLLALGQMVDCGIDDHDYDAWMSIDCSIVAKCDAVFKMKGASKGGDIETEFAKQHNIPVFTDIEEMEIHFGL